MPEARGAGRKGHTIKEARRGQNPSWRGRRGHALKVAQKDPKPERQQEALRSMMEGRDPKEVPEDEVKEPKMVPEAEVKETLRPGEVC